MSFFFLAIILWTQVLCRIAENIRVIAATIFSLGHRQGGEPISCCVTWPSSWWRAVQVANYEHQDDLHGVIRPFWLIIELVGGAFGMHRCQIAFVWVQLCLVENRRSGARDNSGWTAKKCAPENLRFWRFELLLLQEFSNYNHLP